MIQNKKQMFIIISAFVLTLLLGSTTYAFFNYTRTGSRNTIKTGRIAFNTTQNGTLNLTNVFPVSSNSVGNDYTQDTVKINITGDTTYSDGIEYLVTAEDVHVETTTGKKVPLTLKVDVTNNLGTEDTDNDQIEYYTDRGGNTSYYKILSESVLYDGQYLLVGYIAPGQNSIDGTINIKAYIDESRVVISDTYDGTESDNMGTSNNWVNNRMVLTTNEWNSLALAGNELSFKIRVEANERTWVDPSTNPNSVGRISSGLKQNITEIYFIKETPIRMQRRYDAATVKEDMTNVTLNEGQVLGWQEGNKLYIASTGDTYLPEDSSGYFANLSNVTKIVFENINTSRVASMQGFFYGCSSLSSIDLNRFDTSNVTNMGLMFDGCSSLTYLDLNNKGSNSLTSVVLIFQDCNNLREINMSGFNFGSSSLNALFGGLTNVEKIDLSNAITTNVTYMNFMFGSCYKLTDLNLNNIDTSNVTNMDQMFEACTSLAYIDISSFNTSNVTNMRAMFHMGVYSPSESLLDNTLRTIVVGNNWTTSNVTNSDDMFYNCTSLVGGNGTTYDSNHVDVDYAIIDGTNNSPGYLTLKTN